MRIESGAEVAGMFPGLPRWFGFSASCLIDVRVQHANERQIAVAFGKIQSITHNEEVRNFEADIVGFYFLHAAGGLIQQDADFDSARFEGAEFGQHAMQGFARIQNVIHQEDIASANPQAQFLGKDESAGFSPSAIAGDTHEIETQGKREITEQVGEEHDRAGEERDDNQFATGEIAVNLAGQFADAARDLGFGDENTLDLSAPARGNGGAGMGWDDPGRWRHEFIDTKACSLRVAKRAATVQKTERPSWINQMCFESSSSLAV